MKLERAKRLQKLPPYLFIEIDRKKKEAQARGMDLVDLGIGDPDRPTPPELIRVLNRASRKPEHHQYPLGAGLPVFRKEVARWMKKRFNVNLNPANEILATIGSKEAVAHMPLAVVNPGDVVLVPDPSYPVYQSGTIFAGGRVVWMPLTAKNKWLPDFSKIKPADRKKARMMWLNYPNNPTAATAPLSFFKKAVEFCRKHKIILVHDMAYSEIYYGNKKPPSVLQVPGAREVAIELHSLSKTFNMTGWRLGFAAGNSELVSALGAVKGNIDSGVQSAIQEMGIAALKAPPSMTQKIRALYLKRRDLIIPALHKAGFEVDVPEAAFYIWIKTPKGFTAGRLCAELLDKVGIVATPGTGFGKSGEGYFRFTLTAPDARLKLAVKRLVALRDGGLG